MSTWYPATVKQTVKRDKLMVYRDRWRLGTSRILVNARIFIKILPVFLLPGCTNLVILLIWF